DASLAFGTERSPGRQALATARIAAAIDGASQLELGCESDDIIKAARYYSGSSQARNEYVSFLVRATHRVLIPTVTVDASTLRGHAEP
ncbi:MAG: hypothetical protein ABIT38_16005, partial [Gemmatimonadaceae bacterium]